MLSKTNKRALVLTRVEFSIRLYCCCHLTGHICNKCVTRLVSLSGITGLVAKFAFRLWKRFGKFSR